MHDNLNTLLQAALAYATKHRLKVFPAPPGEKKSYYSKEYADDGARWGATNNPNLLKKYWRENPEANIGLPTGAENGFFVVEVDTKEGHATLTVDGQQSLDKLIADNGGEWPQTRTVRSPSGSRHFYFTHPAGRKVNSSTSELGEGIDVKGDGGMVIAPPSVNPKYPDRCYEVENPDEGTINAPAWLLDLVCKKPGTNQQSGEPQAPIEKLAAAMEIIPNDDVGVVWEYTDPETGELKKMTGRDGWAKIGLALYRASGGSDEGCAIFDKWSAKNLDKYHGGARETWCKKFARSPPNRIGAGTIFMLANAVQPGFSRDWDQEHGVASPAGLPVIRIKPGREDFNIMKAQDVLIQKGVKIFQYAGKLMRPIVEDTDAADGRKTKTVRLRLVTPEFLNVELCQQIYYERFDARKKKWGRVRPDKNITADILSQEGYWMFPKIFGVITTPTLRSDGSILSTPGYDRQTGLLLLSPPEMPTIPDNPTKADALKALELLKTLLAEFPFVEEEEEKDGKKIKSSISRSVALSGMITPIVRGAFPVAPAHCANSAVSGSGKSYLWDVTSTIATGRWMPVMPASDEKEAAKHLQATLVSGQPLVSLDNVNGELGGDTLCQAIERPRISIRPFGKNTETIEIDVRGISIFMTGNNLTLVGDVNRRVISATIDPRLEQPELRKFNGNPVQTVLRDRGKYIAACLTICRAYAVAGRPGKADPLASFEGWSDTVRSALMWLGEADPTRSIQNTRREDPQRVRLHNMLDAWSGLFGNGYDNRTSLAVAVKSASGGFNSNKEYGAVLAEALLAAMVTVAPKRADMGGGVDVNVLGKWLRSNKGKIVDGLRFMNESTSVVAQWYVEKV
jgi:hypothetical protein